MSAAAKGAEAPTSGTPLTGRKVLMIFVAMFGTIIAVNLTLAFNAVATFPGVETRNSYTASQNFDEKRAAQQALGWTSSFVKDEEAGELQLTLLDADGVPLSDVEIGGVLGRATNVNDDLYPEWRFEDGLWRAPARLAEGNWDLRLLVTGPEGETYRRRLKLRIAR
jgi:nitrogen fixation protein FixH